MTLTPDRDDNVVLDAENDGTDDDGGQGGSRNEGAVGHQKAQRQQNDGPSYNSTLFEVRLDIYFSPFFLVFFHCQRQIGFTREVLVKGKAQYS